MSFQIHTILFNIFKKKVFWNSVCVCVCVCVCVYIYISAGQQLIVINRIQNKCFYVHNICVCTVYTYYVYCI